MKGLLFYQSNENYVVCMEEIRRAKEQLKELQKIAVEIRAKEISNRIHLKFAQEVAGAPPEQALVNTEPKS